MAESVRWEAAGVCMRGARHVVDGTPCQDAVRVYRDDALAVIAVADGHGDPKHARSEDGARIAVDVMAALLRSLGRQLLIRQQDEPPIKIQESLEGHLPQRINWEWNRRVKAHAGHLDPDGAWHTDLLLYGTTALGAVFTDRLALFIQLGDGDILLVEDSGATECIFDLHEDMYGSLTHSLCQPGSAAFARVRCQPLLRPAMAMLSSDGVRDCLQGEPDAFLGVGQWLLRRVEQRGWGDALAGLPDWLSELSRRGNGDDVTLGLLHWRQT
ncbi:MAG: protein phosphatase 2C domain-containing protein [Myxococcota bacterium]